MSYLNLSTKPSIYCFILHLIGDPEIETGRRRLTHCANGSHWWLFKTWQQHSADSDKVKNKPQYFFLVDWVVSLPIMRHDLVPVLIPHSLKLTFCTSEYYYLFTVGLRIFTNQSLQSIKLNSLDVVLIRKVSFNHVGRHHWQFGLVRFP